MKKGNSFSRMTLGTVQLGLNYGIANNEGKPQEEKAFSILETALESGINCLDTAADYGDSEKVIGKFLKNSGVKRQDIKIVTKFKLGSISMQNVEAVLKKTLENSLRNLNTDYVDILLMHNANEFAEYGKALTEAFGKVKSEGLIRSAGASCYEFRDIELMLNNDLYEAFQIPVNMLDTRITRGDAAKKLEKKIIFARSVFLQGLFFLDPSTLKGNLKEIAKFLTEIRGIATEMKITVAQLAVSYVHSLSYVDSLVIGADNPEQLKGNAYLLNSGKFDKKTMTMIEERTAGAPEWLFMPYLWDKQK
jgi:aryl-alcohol dehydrogenase-like predicted oxidoreductase